MPGRGPAPKDPATRARRNKDPIAPTYIHLEPGEAPELPAGYDWHPMTRRFWEVWTTSPLTEKCTDAEWLYLLDTARLHSAFWDGDFKQSIELRNRMAKFGATPEDRAKLRIFSADADAREEKRPATSSAPTASPGGRPSLRLMGDATT